MAFVEIQLLHIFLHWLFYVILRAVSVTAYFSTLVILCHPPCNISYKIIAFGLSNLIFVYLLVIFSVKFVLRGWIYKHTRKAIPALKMLKYGCAIMKISPSR